MPQQISKGRRMNTNKLVYFKKVEKPVLKVKALKSAQKAKHGLKRTFDTYPSAYANLAASKYCKDPNYAKKSKGGKRKGK